MQPQPMGRSKSGNGSIRSMVFDFLERTPESLFVNPMDICHELNLDYRVHGAYVKKLKSQWKNVTTVTSNGHDTHRNKYSWYLPEWRSYREQLEKTDFHFGWELSPHNKLWHFKHSLGSILWHNTDRIELHLKGSPQMAKAKQLWANAFFRNRLIDDIRQVDMVFDKGVFVMRHHTFKLGERIPRFQIEYFAKSHGLEIYSDGSHPDSIEVAETKPFWLDDLNQIKEDFTVSMAEHMRLLESLNAMQKRLDAQSKRGLINWLRSLVRRAS